MARLVTSGDAALLTISGLTKTFPGCVALDRFEIEVGRGEVMALVGQNGCGKSTFIKLLSGYHQPDPGFVARFAGRELRLGEPNASHDLGIHFVHQDLGLLDDLSAAENLAIGAGFTTRRGGLISWRRQRRRTTDALAALGYDFDVSVPVSRLSPSQRVGVAIARALCREAEPPLSLLVLDEPTASMPQAEVDLLFAAIRRLRDTGTATLFVSHRLNEVFAIADRVTVARDGTRVAVNDARAIDHRMLVEQILGRPAEFIADHPSDASAATAVLSARGLTGRQLRHLDLDLHAGEVLGVTGLTGSGREELAALLFGAEQRRGGTIEMDGRSIDRLNPAVAKRLGMAMVPANRRTAAVVPGGTVRENLTLARLDARRGKFFIGLRAERAEVDDWLTSMSVTPHDCERSILALSGGNQQKVLLARWLRLRPRVVILDEPTQGIDVGTKPEIYTLLRQLAAGGAGVIICSTDSEELIAATDRVVVLAGGVARAELGGASLTVDRLNHEIVAA